jgi:hypothetical protein
MMRFMRFGMIVAIPGSRRAYPGKIHSRMILGIFVDCNFTALSYVKKEYH